MFWMYWCQTSARTFVYRYGGMYPLQHLNTLKWVSNGRHFWYEISKCLFFSGTFCKKSLPRRITLVHIHYIFQRLLVNCIPYTYSTVQGSHWLCKNCPGRYETSDSESKHVAITGPLTISTRCLIICDKCSIIGTLNIRNEHDGLHERMV